MRELRLEEIRLVNGGDNVIATVFFDSVEKNQEGIDQISGYLGNSNYTALSGDLQSAGWTERTEADSYYHGWGYGYRTWTKSDSNGGAYEVVIDKANGGLVTNPTYAGTYDVFNPTGFLSTAGHVLVDVTPYLVFGNSPSDFLDPFRFIQTGQWVFDTIAGAWDNVWSWVTGIFDSGNNANYYNVYDPYYGC